MPNACYVYAIVGRDTPLPAVPAGADTELAKVPWRELAAVTGRVPDGGVKPTADAVRHHEAVVEAVRREGPALPVRFGTVFRDAASVASALAEQYEPLAADLARLGDKVELSLTALWEPPLPNGDGWSPPRENEEAPASHGAGARYLYARAAAFRRDEALKARARVVAGELERGLGGLALAQRVSFLLTPRVAVRATYLLNPTGVDAFKAAFEGTVRAKEVRVLLTGPWPPYSFVRRPEMEDAAARESRFAQLAQLLTETRRGNRG